jgi:hypothetical protein
LLLVVAQLPLLAGAYVGALEVSDEYTTRVGPIVDLVPHASARATCMQSHEVKRQVLDDKEIVSHSPGVARESVVLEPHAGVGVPIISRHIGQCPEARGELRIVDAPAKSSRTPLVQ